MDSDSDYEEGNGDLANYNLSSFQQGHSDQQQRAPNGILGIVKSIALSLFEYVKHSLNKFPIISFLFCWFFVISGLVSIITRWFISYFYLNPFRPFKVLSYVSFLMPISLPMNWATAATMAYHGARIEEMRGSSYLLCFIVIITALTNTTLFVMQLFLDAGPFPRPDPADPDQMLPLRWIQSHITLFDAYGWEFLPFAIVMLHGFLSKHPYISVMGLPFRLHMIPTLIFSGVLYGFSHGFRLPLAVFVAIVVTWIFKHVWLSTLYSRLTGLLLISFLCTFGPLEQNIEWRYDSSKSEEEQIEETEQYWLKTYNLRRYIISTRTSEHMGELQGCEQIISFHNIHHQNSQLTFLQAPHCNSRQPQQPPLSNYALTTTRTDGLQPPPLSLSAASLSTSSPPSTIDFTALNSGVYDEMSSQLPVLSDDMTSSSTPLSMTQPPRSQSNSSDEMAGLTRGYQDSQPIPSSQQRGSGNNSNTSNNSQTLAGLSSSSSSSMTSFSSRNNSDENSALIEGGDQMCFGCHGNDNGKECLRHLKFKSFVYKHTKSEMDPQHVQYIAVKDFDGGVATIATV
jgi:hypothetical protein